MAIDRRVLLDHLAEQADYLRSSAAAFDAGAEHEAKRLAVTLRVLLHDTVRSKSLLGQIVDLPVQRFPCVNSEPVPDNAAFYSGGMYSMGMGAGGAQLFPKTVMSGREEDFTAWWREPCTKSGNLVITRKTATLALSNQGGGAHIDPSDTSEYRKIVEFQALGWMRMEEGAAGPTPDAGMNNPLPAVVRATTAEVSAFIAAMV